MQLDKYTKLTIYNLPYGAQPIEVVGTTRIDYKCYP